MIARLRGTIVESTPLLVVVDVNGVGYEVHVPVSTAERLSGAGSECDLFIHSVFREDSATLYGFASRDDRDFFRLLVERVSGIGPKIGIAILSRMSTDVLRGAIAASDVALLSKCPGIGRKTAERLVIELKDKVVPGGAPGSVGPASGGAGGTVSGVFSDAVASLVTLGYKPADADKLVRQASQRNGPEATVEELLRSALS